MAWADVAKPKAKASLNHVASHELSSHQLVNLLN